MISCIDNINTRNNSIAIEAKIIDKTYHRSESSIDYRIEYTINEETYISSLSRISNSYQLGDIIQIYCSVDNPLRIFTNSSVLQPIIVLVFFIGISFFPMRLGYFCIKKFNLFKYKRYINVD